MTKSNGYVLITYPNTGLQPPLVATSVNAIKTLMVKLLKRYLFKYDINNFGCKDDTISLEMAYKALCTLF